MQERIVRNQGRVQSVQQSIIQLCSELKKRGVVNLAKLKKGDPLYHLNKTIEMLRLLIGSLEILKEQAESIAKTAPQ